LVLAERDAWNAAEVHVLPDLASFRAVHVYQDGVGQVAQARGEAPLRLQIGLEQREQRAKIALLVGAHAGEGQD